MDDPRVDLGGRRLIKKDPVKAAELRRTYARLLQALDSLPGPMRTSVVLVALQGLSHAEAAVVQDCSEGTIAWRIHQARARLRPAMEKRIRAPQRRGGLSDELTRLLSEWVMPIPSPSR
jgi:RNA polymerase sigma-70 factor (ECF subfamily)